MSIYFLHQVAAATAVTGFLRRILILHKQHKSFRRSLNQIEPKIVPAQTPHQSEFRQAALSSPREGDLAAFTSTALQSRGVETSAKIDRKSTDSGAALEEASGEGDISSFASGRPHVELDIGTWQRHIPHFRLSEGGDLSPRASSLSTQSPGASTRRSPQFFGPGEHVLRERYDNLFSADQGIEPHYASSSVSSYMSDFSAQSKKASDIGVSLDAAMRQVVDEHPDDDIDLRQVFGKDYIQELSVNLTPRQRKVTVKSRDSKGNTALHIAAWRGDRLGCHFLISNGADVAAVNDDARTYLPFPHASYVLLCSFPLTL